MWLTGALASRVYGERSSQGARAAIFPFTRRVDQRYFGFSLEHQRATRRPHCGQATSRSFLDKGQGLEGRNGPIPASLLWIMTPCTNPSEGFPHENARESTGDRLCKREPGVGSLSCVRFVSPSEVRFTWFNANLLAPSVHPSVLSVVALESVASSACVSDGVAH